MCTTQSSHNIWLVPGSSASMNVVGLDSAQYIIQ